MNLAVPWLLLLLLPVALSAVLTARGRRRQRDAACRLKGVAPQPGPVRLGRRDWLVLAALGAIVLALARPQWNPRPYGVQRRARDLVLVLDVSRSMLASDVFPSRLEAARIAIHEALPAWAGQRIALVTFAGSAAVPVPLTLDHEFVRYMLDRADPTDLDLGSTSLQAALEKAAATVLADAAGGSGDLVLFTDGEDHLSDLEKTAEIFAKCEARVLLIGLGDPVAGARVPAASGGQRSPVRQSPAVARPAAGVPPVASDGRWMRYQDAVVVSRLDESTLRGLAAASPRVTYYPARTRPIDLVPLYQKLTAGASDDVVVGERREVRYTEGYPYLLALAVLLWLAASHRRAPAAPALMLLVLVLPGCNRPNVGGDEAAFRAKVEQGEQLLQQAREQSAVDPLAARALLVDGREALLRAALLRPGDRDTARRITAATRQLHELDAALEKQRAEQAKRRENLGELIRQLEGLTARETRLAEQSRLLLRRRPSPPERQLQQLAGPARGEQQSVYAETARVQGSLAFQQNTLRELLKRAYGSSNPQLPTEVDPAADLIAGAVVAQQQAVDALDPQSLQWPRANIAFHVAAGRLQQAIEALRALQPPSTDADDNPPPPSSDNNIQGDFERLDAGAQENGSQPPSPADFQSTLSLRSLPMPNYTSADILAEEAANQELRAKQQAARAAAKVEKNW